MTRRLRRFRLRRLIPSPAMAVALTALFMAMGGSAYALVITGKSIRNNTVTGKDIRKSSLRGHDLRSDSVGGRSIKEATLGTVPVAALAIGSPRFAVVSGDGGLVRGRSVTSVARTAPGRYQVIFSAPVTRCGFYGGVADTGAGNLGSGSTVTLASLASNANGVSVRTWGPAGNETGDRPFHLIVFC